MGPIPEWPGTKLPESVYTHDYVKFEGKEQDLTIPTLEDVLARKVNDILLYAYFILVLYSKVGATGCCYGHTYVVCSKNLRQQ